MMIVTSLLCLSIFLTIGYLPYYIALALAILMAQRVVEFFLVYSRHFIFNQGVIFDHLPNANQRGQWFVIMFSLSIAQVILIFSTWYQLVSKIDPAAFSQQLGRIGSLYFSLVTFLTVGYGDIVPVSPLARLLVIFQGALTFYTLTIVINGMIAIHFSPNKNRLEKKD